MNRTKKLVTAALLLGMLAAFLFGCQPSPTPTSPPPGAHPAVSPETPTPGAEPTAAQPKPTKVPPRPIDLSSDHGGVITFAIFPWLLDAYQPILDEFHKQYPTITVQVKEMPLTMDPRQIASAADTTLLLTQSPTSGYYFLDLTPLQEGDPTFDPDSYWPGILDACQDAEGRIYGLPISVDLAGIFYHEQAFDAAGLPYPQPGWTWDDFQKAANALAKTGAGQPVYGFLDDSFMNSPDETLLSSRIHFLLDGTGGEIDVELFERELQWYLSLVQSGSLYAANTYPQQSPLLAPEDTDAWSKAWNAAWKASRDLFQKNPPAMWRARLDDTYWADLDVQASPDGGLTMSGASGRIIESKPEIGWAPFPISAADQNDHTTPASVTCAVISSGTAHPRSAWTWLNFLASHPIIPEWTLSVAAQPAAVEASGLWSRIPQKMRAAVLFGVEHGWYANWYPQEVMAVNRALLAAVSGNSDLQTALQDAGGQVAAAALPTPDPAPIVVAPPKPTVSPGAIKVTYFSPYLSVDNRIETLAEEFHELHPDISVDPVSSLDVEGGAATLAGVADLAGEFDCFTWLPDKDLPTGSLHNLDQFLAIEETDLRNDFTSEALNEFSQEGKLYGLPLAYRPNLVYYNADLLAQLGLEPPAVDWTYADFMELVNAATSGGAQPVYGFALEYPSRDTELFLAGQGAPLVDSGGEAPAYLFDTPATRAALQWLAEQVKAGVVFPVTSFDMAGRPNNIMQVRQLILDGRVAFWMSWFDPDLGGSYSLEEAPFKIGVAPVPLPGGAAAWRPSSPALGQYISRDAKNARACWDWIKFLALQPDNSLGIPASRSVRESDGWLAQVGPERAAVYAAAIGQRRAVSQEDVYALGPIRAGWYELLDEVLHGADPLPLLADLQARANNLPK